MKTHLLITAWALALSVSSTSAANWTAGMKEGKPEFKSMGPLAFGPDGILFVADAKSAAVTAIATGDTQAATATHTLKVEGINQKLAGLLGTSADQILIDDMVVNPVSRNVYLAVSRGRGPEATPVLIKVGADGQPTAVALDKVKFSRGELPDAPADAVEGEGRRARNNRLESITDLAFYRDRLLIAGLSNEAWNSTFRAIPFPFETVANGTSVQIYHGAHGRFETDAPIRTFVPLKVGETPSLIAAYTCTPLVQVPISDLKPGAKVKGKTVAELGNRNRPLDMIVYQKDGKDFLLLANSSRGIMKIDTAQIAGADSIEARVADKEGVGYETIADWTGVEQLDQLDNHHAVMVRRGDGGLLNLESQALP